MSASEDIVSASQGDLPLRVHTAPTVCSNLRGRHKGFVVSPPSPLPAQPQRGGGGGGTDGRTTTSADRMGDVVKNTCTPHQNFVAVAAVPSSDFASLPFTGEESWDAPSHRGSGGVKSLT